MESRTLDHHQPYNLVVYIISNIYNIIFSIYITYFPLCQSVNSEDAICLVKEIPFLHTRNSEVQSRAMHALHIASYN